MLGGREMAMPATSRRLLLRAGVCCTAANLAAHHRILIGTRFCAVRVLLVEEVAQLLNVGAMEEVGKAGQPRCAVAGEPHAVKHNRAWRRPAKICVGEGRPNLHGNVPVPLLYPLQCLHGSELALAGDGEAGVGAAVSNHLLCELHIAGEDDNGDVRCVQARVLKLKPLV